VRRKARHTDHHFGWLFPVLAPFLVLAVIMITISVPLVAHWQASSVIRRAGGHIRYSTATAPTWFGVPDSILVEAESVTLRGPQIGDEMIDPLISVRGGYRLRLIDTSITDEGLSRLQLDRADVTIDHAGATPP